MMEVSKGHAARTGVPVSVVAHIDGGTKEVIFNPDGTNEKIWEIDRGQPFTLDLVKEKLANAYAERDEPLKAEKIIDIIDLCEAADCKPLRWFRKLLTNHFEGIIAHATYPISSGKVEGTNQRIKTLRRQGYRYPDDQYFFLKLFDMSRSDSAHNP